MGTRRSCLIGKGPEGENRDCITTDTARYRPVRGNLHRPVAAPFQARPGAATGDHACSRRRHPRVERRQHAALDLYRRARRREASPARRALSQGLRLYERRLCCAAQARPSDRGAIRPVPGGQRLSLGPYGRRAGHPGAVPDQARAARAREPPRGRPGALRRPSRQSAAHQRFQHLSGHPEHHPGLPGARPGDGDHDQPHPVRGRGQGRARHAGQRRHLRPDATWGTAWPAAGGDPATGLAS